MPVGGRVWFSRGMKRFAPLFALPVAVALMASSCTSENVGQVIGGAAGGYLGSQFGSGEGQKWATIGGTLIGAWAGGHIAKSMSEQDRAYHGRAAEEAYDAPIGEEVVWDNPETGNSGSVTPVREGTHSITDEYCREFQQTIIIDGETQRAYGTACRQPDGSWRIVS